MIKYHIEKDQIIIKGHAMYSKYGTDIVCSSISTLVITHINLIELFNSIDKIEFRITEGEFYLKVLKHNDVLDKIFLNITNTLKELNKQYPKNITEV